MDLENWKKKYFFLKNVLGMFEKYNSNVTVLENSVYTACNFIGVPGVYYGSKYNEFCAKLMRNIRLIDDPSHVDITGVTTSQGYVHQIEESSEVPNKDVQCTFLNKWIYYYIYKKPVPDDVIREIFRITHRMLNANHGSYKYNIETIQGILKEEQHHDYSACLKYIRECVNIYKKMNKEHCKTIKREDNKCVTTCGALETFKNTYESDIYDLLPQQDEVLNLNNEKMDAKVELELSGDDYYVESSEQLSGSLQRNLSTGAAAAAGTGALLLALNKFTPVGSWLRSGKRRTPEVENILEGGPSEELFLNDPDYMHMNSDTTSYNVGYGPT